MANSYIQIPADSTGKLVDTYVTAVTSQHREVLVIGDPSVATGVATVTSSAGLAVTMTSGVVTLSSVPTVATTGTLLANLPVFSGAGAGVTSSYGLSVILNASSGGFAPVTTSGGLGVTILGGAAAGSTAVNLTNYSDAGAGVTSSYGLVTQISSGSYLIRSLSSGTVTLSSNPTIISASSGVVQVLTSGTLIAALTSGTVTLSSNPTIVSASSGVVQVLTSGTLITALTSGTVTLSSNPTVVSASSGVIQVLTSGTLIAALSSGTVTLSSNPTIISASSGLVGLVAWSSPLGAGHGVTGATYVSSSSTNSLVVKSSPGTLYGFYAFNSTASLRYLHIHNTTSSPVAGTTILTDQRVGVYGIPYSTGGAGAQHIINPFGVYCGNGISLLMLSGADSTSTGVIGASDIALTIYYI